MKKFLLPAIIFAATVFTIDCTNEVPRSHMVEGSFFNIDTTSRTPDIPLYSDVRSWSGIAWRGERTSAQLLIWSQGETESLDISVSDLMGNAETTIGADQITLYSIQYVMTDVFAEGCTKTGITMYDSSLVADILRPLNLSVDLMPGTPELLWISIDIPHNAVPGIYSGTIELSQNNRAIIDFEIEIEVQSPELPKPDQWSFHLDLWQNPFAEARYYKVDPWTKEHLEYMKPTLEILANAGQKCITTSITDQPWGGQTFDPFQSMISGKKKMDGTWSYDYSIFDSWVEFAMKCGIDQQINCYSMISWSNEYSYFDETEGKDITMQCKPGSKEYRQLWAPFLRDFHGHLKKKNWADITTISMDERSLEDLRVVLDLVATEAPGLRIAFAGNYHPELNDNLYDLSVASKHVVPLKDLQQRRDSNSKTTFYVCCVEQQPNTFSFSNPAEATLLGWYAAYRQFDGMLRWSYNSWTEDPMHDSRFRRFPAGDTYMVYPGGVSSVRFERLREGIQDYEKIRILRHNLSMDDSPEAVEKLSLLNTNLATFDLGNLSNNSASELVLKGKSIIKLVSE